jgi:hypoxanthine phosphoribosyltransferase
MIGDLLFEEMIPPGAINAAIARIAGELSRNYAESSPLVVCVLNGAAIFHADLIRMMPIPLEVDYVRVASYHGGIASTGNVKFTAGPSTQIEGRNVILVEDIVDTGRTVDGLRRFFNDLGARSVVTAALLFKPDAHALGEPPEHRGFEIPNRFVVGFGLDYRHQGRNLPGIYVVKNV